MEKLISALSADFPALEFIGGDTFSWSPNTNQITYNTKLTKKGQLKTWSLLHEVGHALLDHQDYDSDFELLLLEAAAWDKAVVLATNYGITIDPDHVQDCLDTYRDWLHRRSTCPRCGIKNFQASSTQYDCHNCGTQWHVSSGRFCRSYRRLAI